MQTIIKYFFTFCLAFSSANLLLADLESTYQANVTVVDGQGRPIACNWAEMPSAPHHHYDCIERKEGGEPNSYDFNSWSGWAMEMLKFEENAHRNSDIISEGIFGTLALRMAGYYDQAPEIGHFGSGEISDKVRITMVNGILCLQEDVLNAAQLISSTHGGTNVHYIFRPTQGWALDIIKSSLVKCGYVSQQAYDIALAWRALIAEMNAVDKGGKIIHYAHSIGAADTFAAKCLLLPEELDMISVITFGSPILFPSAGFHSVVNYASVRDFIPFLRKMAIVYNEDNNFVWVGSYLGIPFIDHLLNNGTYRSVLEDLGQQFVSNYGEADE